MRVIGIAAAVVIACTLASGLAWSAPASSCGDKPEALKIDGTQTLVQRVLTRPGAKLRKADGSESTIPPLSLYYVFGRKQGQVEIGRSRCGPAEGSIDDKLATPWRHNLVVLFTNPAPRDLTLLYRDRAQIKNAVGAADAGAAASKLRQQIVAAKGDLPADFPVVAMEPEDHVDLKKNFYLMPILEFEDALLGRFSARLLQLAVASKQEGVGRTLRNPAARKEEQVKDLRVGVVFAIDTSLSMQQYINRTREAVELVYKKLAGTRYKDQFSFGLVAYRADHKLVPGLGYTADVVADLKLGENGPAFIERIKTVAASKVDSAPKGKPTFAEDAIAGLEAAVQKIDWSGYQGRFVILITDASTREGAESTTGMGPDEIRALAQKEQIAIYALHLLTKQGKQDHAAGKSQYEKIAAFPGVKDGSLYYPVEEGNEAAFSRQVQSLVELLTELVDRTSRGELIFQNGPAPAKKAPAAPQEAAKQEMLEDTLGVFRAMQLAHLGTKKGTPAPQVFEAWAADIDLAKPSERTLDVRVLLTKNQLSDLRQSLRTLLDGRAQTKIARNEFFERIKSLALRTGRNPADLGRAKGPGENLETSGVMGEYLTGLPYQSRIMQLTQDKFDNMTDEEDEDFGKQLESKMRLYRKYDEDPDLWIQVGKGDGPGDTVYPIPLDELP
jgi:hypothetical protein